MIKFLSDFGDLISKPLKTRPLAVFSILSFVFIIMRLYFPMQPLFVLAVIIVIFLLTLNICGKINNFITIFICISMFLGIFSVSYKIDKHESVMKVFDDKLSRIEGTISSIPQSTIRGLGFYLDVDKGFNIKGEEGQNFKIYAIYKGDTDLKFGDKITFNGYLKRVTASASQFGMHYLAKGASLTASQLVLIDVSGANFPKNLISDVRNYILSIGDKYFSGDASMLFKALVAGDKSEFSDELSQNLSASGLSHIAAVSGLHVSILGLAIFNLLRKRNKLIAAIASVFMVCLFTLVTGAAPSTVRAAIMFASFILAKLALQENDSFTALCFSAMVLAVFNPYVIYDWGFILSFLSVLGIQLFSQRFKKLLRFLPEFLADSIGVTLSAQIMTVPALAEMFGELPVYSIFANIMISTVFLFALYLCIVFVFVATIPGVNYLIAAWCTFFLEIVAAIASFFANLPNSTIAIDSFNVWEYICYYGLIIMFVFRKKIPLYIFGLIGILCSAYLLSSVYVQSNEIKEYNICEESVMIIDEGTKVLLANDNLDEVRNCLKDWGWYSKISSVVLKAADSNQIDGLVEINSTVGIDKLFIPKSEQNSNIDIIARKMRIDVYYYSEDKQTDLYELAKELAE